MFGVADLVSPDRRMEEARASTATVTGLAHEQQILRIPGPSDITTREMNGFGWSLEEGRVLAPEEQGASRGYPEQTKLPASQIGGVSGTSPEWQIFSKI